jgi:nitrate/TMAO reductase-like tetraheme cytochrome c subunit
LIVFSRHITHVVDKRNNFIGRKNKTGIDCHQGVTHELPEHGEQAKDEKDE